MATPEIPDDFAIGYGLDLYQYRNLGYIATYVEVIGG